MVILFGYVVVFVIFVLLLLVLMLYVVGVEIGWVFWWSWVGCLYCRIGEFYIGEVSVDEEELIGISVG